MPHHKIPVSVLVVIHTQKLEVLLLERADRPGFWQSVTGSQDEEGEILHDTAARELMEETGLVAGDYILTDWQKQNRVRDLSALASPLCAGRDAQHRACIWSNLAREKTNHHCAARTLTIRVVALAGGGEKGVFMEQPRGNFIAAAIC